MGAWKKIKIGKFLFEREGKYKPDDEAIAGLRRIEKIDFSGNFHIAQKPSRTNMILICPDDLVISGINVSKGAMGIYHGDEDVTATIHYSSYTFDTAKIDVEYFKRFLKSAEFIRLLQEQVKGGIKTEIKPKHILPLEIDLPNIKEQRKIVAHFKSIETEDGELKHELTHQQTLLKKLRQQILQEAIEGRLTKDWRAQNPNIEPASELLACIQAEKGQLIKDKKIKKQKPLPAITEAEKPFELPESWVWCRLGKVCYKITDGFHNTPPKIPHGFPYIAATHVKSEKIDWDSCYYVSEEFHRELYAKAQPQKGDILLVNIGAGCGTPAIIDVDYEFSFKNTAILKFNQEYMHNKYLFNYFILSKESIYTDLTKGGLQPFLSLKVLNGVMLPLPPLHEQKAIVTKVEKLLALCDQLQTQITENQTHAEGLMQAVLKEAFSQSSAKPVQVLVNA